MTIQTDIDAIDATRPVNASPTAKPTLKSVRDNFAAIKVVLQALLDAGGLGATDTDMLTEGSTNLYFTEARVRSAVLTGLSTATVAVISATDSVLSALGKLQAQILGINKVFHIQLANAGTTIPTGLIDYELINTAWNRTITGWYVKARGSSTGSIVLNLLINGSSAATITLSSANSASASSLSIAWSVSDVITLSVTSGTVDFFELQLITARA